MQPYKLTREELYEAVRLEPMRTLAKRYGVSDVALAKICRRHDVPLPGRGYWAKLAAGKAPARPSLPAVDGDEESIFIGGRDEPLKEDEPADPEIAAAVAAHTPAQPIEIPTSLEGAGSRRPAHPAGPERRQAGRARSETHARDGPTPGDGNQGHHGPRSG
jgi:hypothetical protein